MRKQITAIALMLALLLMSVAAAAEEVYAERTLPVLESPGGRILGEIRAGAAVSVRGEGEWRTVRLAGLSGSVAADGLTDSRGANETHEATVFSPYGTPTVVLRSVPSDSYSTQGILRAGDGVRVLGSFSGYMLVRSAAGVGFLAQNEVQ